MLKKTLKIIGWLLLALVVIIAGLIAWDFDNFQRHFLGGVKVYETTAPTLPDEIRRPAILVFSKTNGYRHADSIVAANRLFDQIAADQQLGIYKTESGAAFSPEILSRFDAVVFNNVSGDVFTPDQRAALKGFIETGGGFVGVHASGGDFSYAWDWYVNALVGAQFIGHPVDPQFQRATIRVEDKTHPATAHLKDRWVRTDEWYSFDKPARGNGYNVLMSLDETTYKPEFIFGQDIGMGTDHPIAWWHCQGAKNGAGGGRTIYSALGHLPTAYAEPDYAAMLKGAVLWAVRKTGEGCEMPAATAKAPAG